MSDSVASVLVEAAGSIGKFKAELNN